MSKWQHMGVLLSSAGPPGLDPVSCCSPLTSDDLVPNSCCTSGTGFLQTLTYVFWWDGQKKNLGAERRVKVTATPTNTHLVDRTRRWTLRGKISFSGWEANWYLLMWWLILLQWKIIIKKPSCFLVTVHLPERPCMNNYQKQTAENASSCPLLPLSC